MTHPTIPLTRALPFFVSMLSLPMFFWTLLTDGPEIWALFIFVVFIPTWIDRVKGENLENLDPNTPDSALFWYKLATLCWPFLQSLIVFGSIWFISHGTPRTGSDLVGYVILVGLMSGIAGIVIAHELMHQKSRTERALGDWLLATVSYGHFRSEHILVHHRYVGTNRDAATARYNESLYAFLWREIPHSFRSAWRVEASRAEKRDGHAYGRSNPFWRYGALNLICWLLAWLCGGTTGLLVFGTQSVIAIIALETVNYVEHYGLVRRHLGNGKYENVAPRHSWNANFKWTNYWLMNLQRHSDHHYKPQRPYPLLQAYDETDAPQLPYGYYKMSLIAFFPNIWRKIMNPRVRRWRSMYYPDITDWRAYNKGTHPVPR